MLSFLYKDNISIYLGYLYESSKLVKIFKKKRYKL